ncbi:hypothetical protein TcWFU_006081 [Taenia crassiceps]|uniref:Uncharacterized protein n=1 Tax=Taenia crassiceps TaxID=6207 RepID=A0ABR4QLG4_9CEST
MFPTLQEFALHARVETVSPIQIKCWLAWLLWPCTSGSWWVRDLAFATKGVGVVSKLRMRFLLIQIWLSNSNSAVLQGSRIDVTRSYTILGFMIMTIDTVRALCGPYDPSNVPHTFGTVPSVLCMNKPEALSKFLVCGRARCRSGIMVLVGVVSGPAARDALGARHSWPVLVPGLRSTAPAALASPFVALGVGGASLPRVGGFASSGTAAVHLSTIDLRG